MPETSRRGFAKTLAGAFARIGALILGAGCGTRGRIHREGSQEFLYLCDADRGVVVKTTLLGEEVFTLGYPRESEFYRLDRDGMPLVKYRPTSVAVAPNGDIYVADGSGSCRINHYNRKGEFLRTFAGKYSPQVDS
jgi:NHL repeat